MIWCNGMNFKNWWMAGFLCLWIFGPVSHVFAQSSSGSDEFIQGQVGSAFENPYWFKDSFLIVDEDVVEAQEAGKQLILYFWQEGCPYCMAMAQKNLSAPDIRGFVQEHFDVVSFNLRGDREVTLPDGSTMSEKEFAIHLKVQYTPTLIVLDSPDLENPKARLNGYRPPKPFLRLLGQVAGVEEDALQAYRLPQGELYPQPFFEQTTRLDQWVGEQPLAVFLETRSCDDCLRMQQGAFSQKGTYELLKKYRVTRYDALSSEALTLPDGTRTSVRDWVSGLKLNYFPTILLYAAGERTETFRMDSYLRGFHVQAALEYVLQRDYEQQPEFQRYIDERSARIRAERGE